MEKLKENYLKSRIGIEIWDEEFQDVFFNKIKQIIPDKNNLTPKQHNKLLEFKNTLLNIKELLSSLDSYDITYSFGIVGGCIRDLLLDKEHKDIDICITLNSFNTYPGQQTIRLNEFIKTHPRFYNYIINNNGLSSVEISQGDINISTLIKAINDILNINNSELFLNNKGEVDNYQNQHINGIIKMLKVNEKPIDLIFTNHTSATFVTTFSFDICRGFINYSDNLILYEEGSELELLDNIIITRHMLKDIETQQLTTNLNGLSCENLEYFLNKHYIKMKEKFPEYKLNYRVNRDAFSEEKEQNRIDRLVAIILNTKLNEEIPNKNISLNRIKI